MDSLCRPWRPASGLTRILHEFRWVLFYCFIVSMACKRNSDFVRNTKRAAAGLLPDFTAHPG